MFLMQQNSSNYMGKGMVLTSSFLCREGTMKTAQHSAFAIPLAMHLSPNYDRRKQINAG